MDDRVSWEHWVERYTQKGYKVIARSWPGMEGDVELRRDPPAGLGKLGVAEIADHYDAIVGELPSPPIIMGHSFGGLVAQMVVYDTRENAESVAGRLIPGTKPRPGVIVKRVELVQVIATA